MADLTPPILKLVTLLNREGTQATPVPCMRLHEGTPGSWLIRDAAIGHAILKSQHVKPFDLLRYFKQVTRTGDGELGAMEGYFTHGPLLRHGQPHHEARKAVVQLYQSIEADLAEWLEDYTQAFLHALRKMPTPATRLAQDYVAGLYQHMIGRQLQCAPADLPPLPENLFDLMPRKATMQEANRGLQAFVDACLANAQHPLESRLWPLITLVVMGKDALQTALLFALHHPDIFDADTLFRLSTPVNVIAREVTQASNIGNQPFCQGDILYVCPSLMETHPTYGRLEFGAGQHICAGRKIALIIANTFLSALHRTQGLEIRTDDLTWTRNLLLTPKERA